jgi:glutathione peroxidase
MSNTNSVPTSIYDFKIQTIQNKEQSMSELKGKTLLIVNVASFCGFTPQYDGLEALYQKYKDRGLVVMGFPCNQFGEQEPGTENEIKEFCDTRFKIHFPLYAKVDVNGPNTHPLYAYLKSQQKGLLGTEAVKWNFTKFLVNKNGVVVDRFAPNTSPESLVDPISKIL